MSKFQPLTLSVEEWNCCKSSHTYAANVARSLMIECEAQAQAAEQAEAALEEMRTTLEKWIAQGYTDGGETPLDDYGLEVVREMWAELQRRRSPTGQEK